MMIFNSDLDNTLIFSHNRKVKGEKFCVEMYQGNELSFLTYATYELLRQVREKICFVPTTTRTVEQYKRIHLGEEEPEYALVCNGGMLLVHGIRDESWFRESLELVSEVAQEMEAARNLLLRDSSRCMEVREPEGLFLYTKSSRPEESADILRNQLDADKVVVFVSRQKLYVIPKTLSKGEAVKRLKKRLNADYVVAAGDSVLDLPMLEAAQRAIVPSELALWVKDQSHILVYHGEEDFSEVMLEFVLKVFHDFQ